MGKDIQMLNLIFTYLQEKNVHMGLPMTIFRYVDYKKIISEIEGIWLSKKDNNFCFIKPKLSHTSK